MFSGFKPAEHRGTEMEEKPEQLSAGIWASAVFYSEDAKNIMWNII